MPDTTILGYHRQYGSTKAATPAPLIAGLKISFDPTQASADTGKVLPAGARVIACRSMGGATGGASPNVNVGTQTTANAYAADLSADTVTAPVVAGAVGLGAVETKDVPIYAGVGASAAAGGTTTVILEYVMDDDGSF